MPTSMAGAVGRGRGDRGTGGEGCNDRTLCGAVASMAYGGVIWISIRIKLGGFGSGVQSCPASGRDRHAHVGMAGAEEKECRRHKFLILDFGGKPQKSSKTHSIDKIYLSNTNTFL